MQHFFVEPGAISEKNIVITGDDVNHIKNVLRMKIGEEISVSDGVSDDEYRCEVASISDEQVVLEIRFVKRDAIELPAKIFLFQGLPKNDKMELIIQKAVELGVYQVIPVATKRAVVKLDEKRAKQKVVRWQAISEAAAKQSKRGIIPEVQQVMSYKEALKYACDMDVKAIPYELAEGMEDTAAWINDCKEKVKQTTDKPSIAIFIGPEGGFADEEISLAMENGITPISLGKRILRTETAGLTTLSILMYELEMLDVK